MVQQCAIITVIIIHCVTKAGISNNIQVLWSYENGMTDCMHFSLSDKGRKFEVTLHGWTITQYWDMYYYEPCRMGFVTFNCSLVFEINGYHGNHVIVGGISLFLILSTHRIDFLSMSQILHGIFKYSIDTNFTHAPYCQTGSTHIWILMREVNQRSKVKCKGHRKII